MKKTSVILTILVLTVLSCESVNFSQSSPPSPVPTAPSSTALDFGEVVSSTAPAEGLTALYEAALPGVVAIRIFSNAGSGLGSGFVFDDQGHIVTNFHVVQGAAEVEVDFASGYKTYGTVIGTDMDSDLAVVKVDVPAEELHPLPLGNSDSLRVGQTVVAIGNPFGLSGTMTTGIVSALGRTLDSMNNAPGGGFFTAGDIIQTDAAINPGNSGGPLFNVSGEVIGINRAIRTNNFSGVGEPVNSGIGFAISINIVRRVVPNLIATGHYDYPYIGVSSVSDLSLHSIEAIGLPQYTGAYITNVTPGSPADKAGLHGAKENRDGVPTGGDLIIGIDGQEIKQFDDLLKYLINNKAPGDTVLLTVLRDGEKLDIELTLDKRP